MFQNKPLGNLLGISLTNFIPLETFDLAFPYIDVWFTDWNSQLLEIENRINLTLVINWCRYYKNALFNSKDLTYVKGYGFLWFAKKIGKVLSGKYCWKFFDGTKKFTKYARKTASKRAIHKKSETTDDFTGNEIAYEITSASKKSPQNTDES